MARALLPLFAALAAAFLWVTNCSGPQPSVVDVRVTEPEMPDQPYLVEATVRNRGPGHGQINVVVRLRDMDTGDTFQDERQVQLDVGETARVVAEIMAPAGSYEPEVEVEYPAR
jgi:hypothetical protein